MDPRRSHQGSSLTSRILSHIEDPWTHRGSLNTSRILTHIIGSSLTSRTTRLNQGSLFFISMILIHVKDPCSGQESHCELWWILSDPQSKVPCSYQGSYCCTEYFSQDSKVSLSMSLSKVYLFLSNAKSQLMSLEYDQYKCRHSVLSSTFWHCYGSNWRHCSTVHWPYSLIFPIIQRRCTNVTLAPLHLPQPISTLATKN
jgi:hypothetical protein